MDLKSGTLITIEERKYIIIETLTHNNKLYAFTNEVEEDENLTDDYYIFEIINNDVKRITNNKLINELLPKFQQKIRTTIEETL